MGVILILHMDVYNAFCDNSSASTPSTNFTDEQDRVEHLKSSKNDRRICSNNW